jgi:hypothetical protein
MDEMGAEGRSLGFVEETLWAAGTPLLQAATSATRTTAAF